MEMSMVDPVKPMPIAGIRVIDLSRFIAGNMLTVLLADFGADVVKVEDPIKGDSLRELRDNGLSTHWKVYGRNKRSVALDLRSDQGKTVLLDLVEGADVLVENFKVGTLEKMGLGPDKLLERNPSLVIVRISGYGQTGAYRDRPGFGSLIEAMSGFAAKNGFPDRPPTLPNMPLGDMVAGVYGAFATMVALRHKERGGRGQVVDLSLLEPLLSILGPDPAVYAFTGKMPERTGSRSGAVAPRNVYNSKDKRYVAVSASTQSMAERLFAVLGQPELIHDVRFRTNSDRLRNVDQLDEFIQSWIAERSQDECLDIFTKAEVTAGQVCDVRELIEDQHVRSREALIEFPDEDAGTILMHNIVPRLSQTPGAVRRAAPDLGADTLAVLSEVGYTAEQIAELARRGVVGIERKKQKDKRPPA
jgi:crotonobetainyl-CoA:carnitine CoA-transferase CaiB-like acyl-CoA transferase